MTDLVYKGKKRRKTVKVARYVRDLSRDDLLISSSDRATTESESDTTTAASSFSSAVTVTPLSSERELSLSNAPSCREVLTSGSNVVHDGDNIQHGRGKTPSDGRWRNKKEINEGNEARSLISRPLGEYERANSFQMVRWMPFPPLVVVKGHLLPSSFCSCSCTDNYRNRPRWNGESARTTDDGT